MELNRSGFLASHNVKLIGTNAESIDRSEDRELFKEAMEKIGVPTIESGIAEDLDTAIAIADRIGYPIIVRPSFTLGGSGGGVAFSHDEMLKTARTGLDASPVSQILVEKYIAGWEEIEFEVMRDSAGNKIIVCSMENIDPVGVHTGDSVVVAPALTLNDRDLEMLRKASLDIVEELEIQGGCNCQYAYNPQTGEYRVIEVNPRVSRSSALASKATGYPIAKVTALIALGYKLEEIKFDRNAIGTAATEPAVDYIVLKFPRWPFDKFTNTSRKLGTQMKATGEVMSIGTSVESALLKAVRGLEIKQDTLNRQSRSGNDIRQRLGRINDLRFFTIFEALKSGMSVDEICEITKFNPYFVSCMKNLADYENLIAGTELTEELYLKGKIFGYTDEALRKISGNELKYHCKPKYRQVDTMKGAFGQMPYYYSYYDESCCVTEDEKDTQIKEETNKILVLGAGPIRIGQGIEFDYSSVKCVEVLRKMGYELIIINNNPETVSTDYDTADRLYFEPVTKEDVMAVIEREKPLGVVVAFGGQTAVKLAITLDKLGVNILGTSAEGIDLAEDREKFDAFLEKLGQSRPKAVAVSTVEEALIAAKILDYPVLLRPSYVIGGQGMSIVRTADEVKSYMQVILSGNISNSVLIDKYMPGKELEVDCISDGEKVLIPGIMEHVERAGIHSGDSIAVYPPYNLINADVEKLCSVSEKIALGIGTKGIVNIQYLIFEGELYVIEVNPRASRTVPYISKVTGVPMVELASKIMLGAALEDLGYGTGLYKVAPRYAVKVPVFSFEKISDANSILGPEMKSTGEGLGIGRTKTEAIYKGLVASGIDVHAPITRGESGILISVEDYDYGDATALAEKFIGLDIKLYATPNTAKVIKNHGIEVTTVYNERGNDDIYDLINNQKIQYLVYTGAVKDSSVGDFRQLYRKAMEHHIPCMTSLDTASALADIISARYNQHNTQLVDINHYK